MGRLLKVQWDERDTPEYLNEQDAAVRVRLQAMWLLRRGKSVSLVADVLDVNYRTVQKWLGWYREGGLEEVLAHRRGGRGRKSYLSDDGYGYGMWRLRWRTGTSHPPPMRGRG